MLGGDAGYRYDYTVASRYYYPDDILNERKLEHAVQFDLVVLQHVLLQQHSSHNAANCMYVQYPMRD